MVRHCFWKMCATPAVCIKPGCLARRPLFHKVNLPSCVAQRSLYFKVNLPSCVARRKWCLKVNLPTFGARRPLCQKVNLPRCEARRHHFMMTCDILRTGQTNILALCYLIEKTYKPAHSNAIQVTEINTLDQITGKKGIGVSRTHIPLKALMILLKRVKSRGVVQANQCLNTIHCSPALTKKNVVLSI